MTQEQLINAMRHITTCRRRSCMQCNNYNMEILESQDQRHQEVTSNE